LASQSYHDPRLWERLGLTDDAAQVRVFLSETSVFANGDLTADAVSTQSIDAVVLAGSVALSGGGTTGVAVSGAGVFTQNKIHTDVQASITGDGTNGIHADNISLLAQDASGISATAGAASLAGSAGGTAGVSVSIGIAVALNEIGNTVDAFLRDADLVEAAGDVTIKALVLPAPLEAATYTSASGTQTLSPGDTVQLADDYANGGQGGRIYRYRGFVPDYTTATDFVSSQGEQSLVSGNTVKRTSTGAIYVYVGDNNAALNLTTTDYGDDDLWELADVQLHAGNTVQVGSSVYRYNGEDDTLNFGTENFSSAPWQLVNPDQRNLGITDFADSKLWELADGTITTRAVAASLAAGFGGTAGIAVSGAGAVAINEILTKANASIMNSSIVAAENVDLDAENSAAITAIVAAASVALGAGGTAGVGVSIGVSIAENMIGWEDGERAPAEVRAFVQDSSIDASGSLTIDANADEKIDALILAGSAAVAAGGTAGVGVSGAGVWANNRIATLVKAFIDGDDDDNTGVGAAAGITADEVALHAVDTSSIHALAGAASISAAFGGTAGVGVSVGVALAQNHISNEVEASIARADDTLQTTGISTPGNVVLEARTLADIDAITAAASVALGAAGTAGIAVSGAGALAKNIILTRTNAFVAEDSVVDSAGAVDLDAFSDSDIDAIVVSVSGAVGIGGTVGIGASVGFALARNFIGWDPGAAFSDYNSDQEIRTLRTGTRVQVRGGVRDGDVYQYIGPTVDVYDFTSGDGSRILQNDDDHQTRVKVGSDIYVWEGTDGASRNLGTEDYDGPDDDGDGRGDGNDNWRLERVSYLAGEDFGDVDLWKLVLPEDLEDASQVQAYIADSQVTAAGDLTLDAESKGTLDATTLAGSVAIGGGGVVGVALSGAGVGVENRVRTWVKSFIDGASLIEAEDIRLTAKDNSRITADAAAASLAGSAAGTVGVSISVGIAVAFNEVSNVVSAYIANSDPVTARGDIFIDARTLGGTTPAPTYTSSSGTRALTAGDTVQPAASYGNGGQGGRVYRYRGFTADFSSAAGTVADPEQELDNGDTVQVAFGHTAGGIAGGIYRWNGDDETKVDLRTQNYSTGHWVPVSPNTRNLGTEDYSDSEYWELADGTITARVGAASLAASFAGVFGGAVSGAGAVATNVIASETSALIDSSNVEQAGLIQLDAYDTSNIVATVVAASVAIGGGGVVGAGISIGASVARNLIGYDQDGRKKNAGVWARVLDSSLDASGDLTLTARADESIDAVVLAGSAAVAGAGLVGVAGSGAGVSAVNRIANDVVAAIDGDGDQGISAASVSLLADDTSAIHALGGAASIAFSFGFAGRIALGRRGAGREHDWQSGASLDQQRGRPGRHGRRHQRDGQRVESDRRRDVRRLGCGQHQHRRLDQRRRGFGGQHDYDDDYRLDRKLECRERGGAGDRFGRRHGDDRSGNRLALDCRRAGQRCGRALAGRQPGGEHGQRLHHRIVGDGDRRRHFGHRELESDD
jgi:hypothetical protein